ncbi:Cytochrome [Forsythia ovata]|uniref:Cytochrome n=1 Tax=Forsythia ovata TaxID=205694 RepID=A0ABD1S2B4_9LAMI
MPRRIPDYPDAYAGWNALSSFGSYISVVGICRFFMVVTITSSSGKNKRCAPSPWAVEQNPTTPEWMGKVPKANPTHPPVLEVLDQAGCKSMDVHVWQRPKGESQQANPQDSPLQYFSENLPRTRIEPALPEDFSPRHLKPYQLAYAPGLYVLFSLNNK